MENRGYQYNYRMDINQTLYKFLMETIEEKMEGDPDDPLLKQFKVLLQDAKKIEISRKKSEAAGKAREARSKKTAEKIRSAISILRSKDIEITPYYISKESGVSFQTVQKWLQKEKV